MTTKTRPLPPGPRTIAEMIPVREAEIRARDAKPRCHIKGHGVMQPRDLKTQTYEQMWCGVWYDCQAFSGMHRCSSSATYSSRELAAYHGEPYCVDAEHFETWDGTQWVPVSKADAHAWFENRATERDHQVAEDVRRARASRRRRVRAATRTEPCLTCGEPTGNGLVCKRCEAGQDTEANGEQS